MICFGWRNIADHSESNVRILYTRFDVQNSCTGPDLVQVKNNRKHVV